MIPKRTISLDLGLDVASRQKPIRISEVATPHQSQELNFEVVCQRGNQVGDSVTFIFLSHACMIYTTIKYDTENLSDYIGRHAIFRLTHFGIEFSHWILDVNCSSPPHLRPTQLYALECASPKRKK